jgi:Kef-type K+ transport system membrane component KefB
MPDAATSLMLLGLAGIVSILAVRPNLPHGVPDIPVYLAVGMFFGAGGLEGLWTVGATHPVAADVLKAVQFLSLYLLMFTSCSGLRFTLLREQSTSIALLVAASILAFGIALTTVSFLDRLAPNPDMVGLSGGARSAYLLVFCLGVMVCSIPFLTKIFISAGLHRSKFASNVLLAACFVDVIVWAIFAVAIGLRNGGAADFSAATTEVLISTGLFFLAIGVGIVLVNVVERQFSNLTPAKLMLATLGLSGGIITLTAMFEIGTLLGMMIAGLVVGTKPRLFGRSIASLEHLSTRVGTPLYFTCVGFGISFSMEVGLWTVVVFFFWSSMIKVGTLTLASLLVVRGTERPLDYGMALNTRGGPGLVLAAASYAEGLIGMTGFFALTAASIVTAIGTDLYMRHSASRILLNESPSGRFVAVAQK